MISWPFSAGRTIEIVRAQGPYLYTADGREILDAAGGAIVANIGHGVEAVAQAMADAVRTVSYVVPPWLTPPRRAVLDELERWLPVELRRVHLTTGGSDAVESALKLALQYHSARGDTERTEIITRSVSYHGTTLATTAASGHAARKRGLAHVLAEYPRVSTPSALHCPLGPHHPDAGRYFVDELDAMIHEVGPGRVAALLAEPITGSSGGAIVPPDEYWPGVRGLCDKHGILLILDEVMTGFGRTGERFGFQHWAITPDIVAASKGLTGGYAPLGGVFATEAIGAAIDAAELQVMFHTYGAHPASCAAAATVLNILERDNLVSASRDLGARLHADLASAFAEHPHVVEVRGRGLLQAIEIVQDRDTLTPFPAQDSVTARLVAKGLGKGVFYYGGGTGEFRDIVCMGPPFIIDGGHIDRIVGTLVELVNETVG